MSQLGEAEGGFGLFFGGVSRPELLKEIFVPSTAGTHIQNMVGDYCSCLIDSAADVAVTVVKVPAAARGKVLNLYLVVIPAETAADMHLDIDTDIGANGELYNTHTSGVIAFHLATTINVIQEINLTAIGDQMGGGWSGNPDYVGVRAIYNAAATDTNLAVLGVRLTWT